MSKIKICLDAGHYGKYNQSPAVKTYYEAEMNWKLHNLLKKRLEEYGIEVIQTRSKQAVDMEMKARGRASKGCDLFISVHSNSVGNKVDESVDYPLVCVPINGSGTELGEKLAKCIETVMGTKQKGKTLAKKGSGNWDYYSVIYGATSVGVPGLILEHSFYTNTKMAKWLLDEKNLDKLAKAEAEVIAAHYGVKKPVVPAAETETKETTATVKLPALKRGDKNASVKALQLLLIGYGYKMTDTSGKVYGADGSFGGATERAVEAYQTAEKLKEKKTVGAETWAHLLGV